MARKRFGPAPELRGKKCILTFGGDPEFELLVDGRVEVAENHYGFCGQVGCDGTGRPVELRPKPGRTVPEVLSNIGKLLSRVYRQGHDLSVSGHTYATGAHIHFGFAGAKPTEATMQDILTVVDDFLGKRLIGLSGRARGNYRKLRAGRFKSYGFEYRTLPSAILHNPRICGIIYAVAKRAAEKIATTGIEYETSAKKGATDAALAALVGKRNVDALNRFVASYGRKRGQVKVDRSGWMDADVAGIGREIELAR